MPVGRGIQKHDDSSDYRFNAHIARYPIIRDERAERNAVYHLGRERSNAIGLVDDLGWNRKSHCEH